MHDILIEHVDDLDDDVKLYRRMAPEGPTFTVVYGLEVHSGLTCQQAAQEFGRCVIHSAGCTGSLDG